MTRSLIAAGLLGLVSAASARAQAPVYGPPPDAGCADAGCETGWRDGCLHRFARWLCFRQTPNFLGYHPTPYYPPLYTWFPTKECGHGGCVGAGCTPKHLVPTHAAPVIAAPAPGPVQSRVDVYAPTPTLPPPPMTSLQSARPAYTPGVVPAGFRLPPRTSGQAIPVNGTR